MCADPCCVCRWMSGCTRRILQALLHCLAFPIGLLRPVFCVPPGHGKGPWDGFVAQQRHASLVGADPARAHSRYLAVWLVDAGAFLRSLFAPVRSLFHGNTNAYIVERRTQTLAAVEQDSTIAAVKGKHYRLLLHAGAASPTSIQAEYWPRKRESQSDFWQENHRSHTIYPNTHLAEGKENCLCRRCEYVRIQLKRLSRQETQ